MSVVLYDFQIHLLITASAAGCHASCEQGFNDLKALAKRGMLRTDAVGSFRLTALG